MDCPPIAPNTEDLIKKTENGLMWFPIQRKSFPWEYFIAHRNDNPLMRRYFKELCCRQRCAWMDEKMRLAIGESNMKEWLLADDHAEAWRVWGLK